MLDTSYCGWVIQFDYDANLQIDRKEAGFGAESCDCCFCRNFFSQWDKVYPSEILGFLETLGVFPPLEVEVVELGPSDDGNCLYSSWIPFFGSILMVPKKQVKGVSFGPFELNVPILKGQEVIQFQYATKLPWVLEDIEYPDIKKKGGIIGKFFGRLFKQI